MQRRQHGVHCYFASIRRQMRQVQTGEEISVVLMQKVGHLLRQPPQLHVPSKAHLVRVDCLLPPKRTPPQRMLSTPTKFMRDISPPPRTSPYVSPDSAGHAPPRCISFQHVWLQPKPVGIERIRDSLIRLFGIIRPVVILKFLVVVVDSSCISQSIQ